MKENIMPVGSGGWKVVLPQRVRDKMLYIARLASPSEVQMLGEVSVSGKTLLVEDLHVIKQRVTGASATFDMPALAQFVETHPHPEKIRCWIHSHVNMGCFWSGTDTGTIEDLAPQGWLLSIVLCLNGSMKARMDVSFETVQKKISEKADSQGEGDWAVLMLPKILTWDDIEIEISDSLSDVEKETLKKSVDENVAVAGVCDELDLQTYIPDFDYDDVDERQPVFSPVRYRSFQSYPKNPPRGENEFRCATCANDNIGIVCLKGLDRVPEFYLNREDVLCTSYNPVKSVS
jgi:proteasome lid subunit RPN8/RPN11